MRKIRLTQEQCLKLTKNESIVLTQVGPSAWLLPHEEIRKGEVVQIIRTLNGAYIDKSTGLCSQSPLSYIFIDKDNPKEYNNQHLVVQQTATILVRSERLIVNTKSQTLFSPSLERSLPLKLIQSSHSLLSTKSGTIFFEADLFQGCLQGQVPRHKQLMNYKPNPRISSSAQILQFTSTENFTAFLKVGAKEIDLCGKKCFRTENRDLFLCEKRLNVEVSYLNESLHVFVGSSTIPSLEIGVTTALSKILGVLCQSLNTIYSEIFAKKSSIFRSSHLSELLFGLGEVDLIFRTHQRGGSIYLSTCASKKVILGDLRGFKYHGPTSSCRNFLPVRDLFGYDSLLNPETSELMSKQSYRHCKEDLFPPTINAVGGETLCVLLNSYKSCPASTGVQVINGPVLTINNGSLLEKVSYQNHIRQQLQDIVEENHMNDDLDRQFKTLVANAIPDVKSNDPGIKPQDIDTAIGTALLNTSMSLVNHFLLETKVGNIIFGLLIFLAIIFGFYVLTLLKGCGSTGLGIKTILGHCCCPFSSTLRQSEMLQSARMQLGLMDRLLQMVSSRLGFGLNRPVQANPSPENIPLREISE